MTETFKPTGPFAVTGSTSFMGPPISSLATGAANGPPLSQWDHSADERLIDMSKVILPDLNDLSDRDHG